MCKQEQKAETPDLKDPYADIPDHPLDKDPLQFLDCLLLGLPPQLVLVLYFLFVMTLVSEGLYNAKRAGGKKSKAERVKD